MMLFGINTTSFANVNEIGEENETITEIITDQDDGTVLSSRWYITNVVEVENEPFTCYSSDMKKMVRGTYKKVATYRVYRDGSGRKYHVKDTYHYTWTGYYRVHTTGVSSNWITDTNYVNVKETYIDRGPVASLFGYLA